MSTTQLDNKVARHSAKLDNEQEKSVKSFAGFEKPALKTSTQANDNPQICVISDPPEFFVQNSTISDSNSISGSSCYSQFPWTSTPIVYESEGLSSTGATPSIMPASMREHLDSEVRHVGAWTREDGCLGRSSKDYGDTLLAQQIEPNMIFALSNADDPAVKPPESSKSPCRSFSDQGRGPDERMFENGSLNCEWLRDRDLEDWESVLTICELTEKLRDGLL